MRPNNSFSMDSISCQDQERGKCPILALAEAISPLPSSAREPSGSVLLSPAGVVADEIRRLRSRGQTRSETPIRQLQRWHTPRAKTTADRDDVVRAATVPAALLG